MALSAQDRLSQIRSLKQEASKDWVLWGGVLVFFLCCMSSWFALDLGLRHPVTGESRFQVQSQFVSDVIPFPLRHKNASGVVQMKWDSDAFFSWFAQTCAEVGWSGVFETIFIAVLAIVAAALLAVLLVLPASRNVACRRGFLPADAQGGRLERGCRHTVFLFVRLVLLVLRAIPEFLWAFLLLILFGPVAIAGILALALHNAGILAKLTSETVEDMEQKPLEALAAMGGGKSPVALFCVAPRAFRQFLVYFFYRWEVCIRETAILGVLAIHTLGLHIDHSFAYFHYDKAMVFILINSVIVVVADLLGSLARRSIRQG